MTMVAKDEREDQVGIACPSCGCKHVPVYDTRPAAKGKRRRLRQCRHCGRRFTTVEEAIGK